MGKTDAVIELAGGAIYAPAPDPEGPVVKHEVTISRRGCHRRFTCDFGGERARERAAQDPVKVRISS